MQFRPQTLRLALAPALLAALAACGGGAADASADELIQAGKFDEAVALIEKQRETVEKGSEAEKELVLLTVDATADEQPELAKKAFLEFAEAAPDAVSAKDFEYAVSQLRTYRKYVEAIEVMDKGMKRWPEDPVMTELLSFLQADAEKDDGAAAALKGLGYTSK
ncbi:MAG: hypothetical protein AAFZ87_05335 [Planctomycetota bacterium]